MASWAVPFVALQSANDQYLIDQKTLSYAISVSALTEMRKRRSVRPLRTTVLALADPVLTDEVVERLKTTYRDLELRQTTDASPGLEQLRSMYEKTRSQFYTGVNAKKEKARTEAGNQGLVHLETQTFLDQVMPLYSFVTLSADQNGSDDGLLRLSEVMNLNSKARVVVFPHSAHDRARSHYGNALIAMSWAWFVAGTPTVILSRWQVDAESVKEFSSDLHRNLRCSSNPAATLHQTILKLRQAKSRNSYEWSGFMIVGDLPQPK